MTLQPHRPPPPPPPLAQVNGSTNTLFVTTLRFDPSYLMTAAGILKVVVIILNLIVFICIQSSVFWSNGRGVYFIVVAHLGFWFSGALLLMYLYHVVEKYHNIKWLKIEMVACLALLVLNLIASTIAVAFGSPNFSAAGFFGYLAMVSYGAAAYVSARAQLAGGPAQGRRAPAKQPPAPPAPPARPAHLARVLP